MLQFNELRITPDRKHLIIDVQVQELDYYDNVYIDSIYFDTQSTYTSSGASSKAVKVYEDITDANKKHIRVFYDIDTIGDQLFFVYVNAKGTPSDDTPCGMKAYTIMGVTYDKVSLYNTSMKGLKEIEGCNPPVSFMNFVFMVGAFKICIKTGNFTKAIYYWKKFFTDTSQVVTSSCGCNG